MIAMSLEMGRGMGIISYKGAALHVKCRVLFECELRLVKNIASKL